MYFFVCKFHNYYYKMFFDFSIVLKVNNPNLFQFIVDFINKKVTVQEVEAFQKMEPEAQQLYIKNYKARV